MPPKTDYLSYFAALSSRDWEDRMFGKSKPDFVSGLVLCEHFSGEIVEPIMRRRFPQVKFASARMDYGSDVLGFDTELSRDHAWAPQTTIFISPEDFAQYQQAISDTMQKEVPVDFMGYPTRSSDESIWHARRGDAGLVRVRVETIESFFKWLFGFLPSQEITSAEWLSLPSQKLRIISAGKIFTDDTGELTALKEHLRWYPKDLWYHVMACQWQKLADREPFAGRCAHVGDEWGSIDNAQYAMHNIISLAFLLEQHHAPYTKWFGTAAQNLKSGPELLAIGRHVHAAATWPQREQALLGGYRLVAEMHNALKITENLDTSIRTFHSRPYKVLMCDRFASALRQQISDPQLRQLSLAYGTISQVSQSDVSLNDMTFILDYKRILSARLAGENTPTGQRL